MKQNYPFISNVYKLLKESEILTERNAKPDTLNTKRFSMNYDLANYNPDQDVDGKEKERILTNVEDQISSNIESQAGYTWRGSKHNINISFINGGKPTTDSISLGDIDTYRDPLWYYPIAKRNVGTYLDANGIITSGHEDIIDRINKKYGLNLDPKESLTQPLKKGYKNNPNVLTNNQKQFLIWRNKYFIPWYLSNSNQGNTLRTKYNNAIAGIKPEQKDIQQNVIDKDISNQTPQMKEYDKTVIEPISKQFEKEPIKAWGNLVNIIKGFDKTEATPQQIYNTLLDLYKKSTRNAYIVRHYPNLSEIVYNAALEYKQDHKEIDGKFESVEENESKNSWLTRNGDYSIFDKLNNIFRLQKESKEKDMSNSRFKVLNEDNVFSSINTNENDFDPSKVTSDIFNDDNEEGAISEKDELKKNKLTKQVLDKINDTLKLNKEVQDILDEIREINNQNDYNTWVVNDEGNTATLASRNAKIFKQNMNLCLSHDNDIEIFKSVKELHDWLRNHNYPMPKNIQLHESIKLTESLSNQFSGLRDYLDSFKKTESSLDEDFCCGNIGDTTSASLGTALQYLYKNKKRESLEKGAFIDKLKELKEDDIDVASDFDTSIQANPDFDSDTGSSSTDGYDTDSDLDSGENPNQDNGSDLGQDGMNDEPATEFGDINIGGYGPDGGNSEEEPMDMTMPQEEYQIVDVLTDSSDNIRVKVKNLTSGKCEYKDLSEIDI